MLVLGGMAFVVYLATMSGGACPGTSADIVVRYAGILPRMTPDFPLWTVLAGFVSSLPFGGDVAFRLNLLNAICGALGVALMFRVMTDLVWDQIFIEKANAVRSAVAARLAGAASALFLAFSVPFWTAATRAQPIGFHVLLLLVLTKLLIQYGRRSSNVRLCVLAFLYGVGVVEFSTLILLAPVFLAGVLFVMWRDEQRLLVKPLVLAAVSALLGLSLYVLTAWLFYGSVGYEIRGYESFFKVLWFMWRDQVWTITRGVPKVGWLILVFMNVVPALTVLTIARRALNDEKDWAFYLLHVILTGLAIAVVFNVRFSPWVMTKASRLQVTPYVLQGGVFGYLAAYWFLFPSGWWSGSDWSVQLFVRRWLGSALAAVMFGLALWAPFRNVTHTDASGCDFINAYADEVVSSLDGREWLVTDGMLDNHILIAAHNRHVPVTCLNLRAGQSRIYQNYIKTLFEEPRYQNLADIGLLALLQEWMMTDPDITQKLALMTEPDLWIGTQHVVVPNGTLFFGAKDASSLSAGAIHEANKVLRAQVEGVLPPVVDDDEEPADAWGFYRKELRRHTAMVANNTGVLMQELATPELAFASYTAARRIDENNVSALLNQSAMVSGGYESDMAADVRDAVRKLVDGMEQKYRVWSLSRYYGYIHAPEMFSHWGWSWARSGQPGIAIAGLRKALEVADPTRKAAVQSVLAGIYLEEGQDEKSELLLKELLEREGSNKAPTLIALAGIARRDGRLDEARDLLNQATTEGGDKTALTLEWVRLSIAAGDLDQARISLEKHLQDDRTSMAVWAVLADVLLAQKDSEGLRDWRERIVGVRNSDGLVSAVEAQVALRERDLVMAREHLDRAIRFMPRNIRMRELMLRLDAMEGFDDEARGHAKQLLAIDNDNALGHYIIGSLQYRNGDLELAEDSFRKSLERDRLPEALNDLAWVVFEQRKDAVEAEALVREALAKNKKVANAWDTLGVILMRQGKLEEAEKALSEAIKLSRRNPAIFLHSAELLFEQGNKKEAKAICEQLLTQRDAFPVSLQEELDRLVEKIGDD